MSDLLKIGPGLFLGSALFNSQIISSESVKKIWIEKFGTSIEFHHDYFPMKEYY